MKSESIERLFEELVRVIKALRTPGTGCPWDLKQNHHTLRGYLIEESYEVLEAIDRGDDTDLCEELGDVLLQVVLHAQVAQDRHQFSIHDVVEGITTKMIRRHPHVFGDTRVNSSEEVLKNWEKIKQIEKEGKSKAQSSNPLASIPRALPALQRAQRVLDQLEKFPNFKGFSDPNSGQENVSARSLGQELMVLVQKAKMHGISAEDCLREETERIIRDGTTMDQSSSQDQPI